MSFPKFITPVVCLLVYLSPMGGRVSANEYFQDAATLRLLQIAVRHQVSPEGGGLFRAQVSSGTNQFTFVMPPDFRVANNSTPQTISLISANGDYSLTLRIINPASSVPRNLSADFYRGRLLTHFSGAKITGEFSRSAANQTGPAFDLQWRNANGIWLSSRTVFIPVPAGILEFSLTAASEKFSGGQMYFDSWLLTFAGKEAGKVDTAPLPAGG